MNPCQMRKGGAASARFLPPSPLERRLFPVNEQLSTAKITSTEKQHIKSFAKSEKYFKTHTFEKRDISETMQTNVQDGNGDALC